MTPLGREPVDAGTGHDDAAELRDRVVELERRLRERVEETAVLDRELTFIRQELAIRGEYIEHLETDLDRMDFVESNYFRVLHELEDLTAEHAGTVAALEAYRQRPSIVILDRVVARCRRVPPVYWLARRLAGWWVTGRSR